MSGPRRGLTALNHQAIRSFAVPRILTSLRDQALVKPSCWHKEQRFFSRLVHVTFHRTFWLSVSSVMQSAIYPKECGSVVDPRQADDFIATRLTHSRRAFLIVSGLR